MMGFSRFGWKTSLSGFVTASAGFVAFSPELFIHWPWIVALAKYTMVGGLAALGVAARDQHNHDAEASAKQIEAPKP